jgi:hypothetical protein
MLGASFRHYMNGGSEPLPCIGMKFNARWLLGLELINHWSILTRRASPCHYGTAALENSHADVPDRS